ncbi:hypothetical protein BDR04DRAFT_1108802 [Suillus decipiens]|nr:hypothetical protein BDR04DRAFT_1108802 [Suillus decipiens]
MATPFEGVQHDRLCQMSFTACSDDQTTRWQSEDAQVLLYFTDSYARRTPNTHVIAWPCLP